MKSFLCRIATGLVLVVSWGSQYGAIARTATSNEDCGLAFGVESPSSERAVLDAVDSLQRFRIPEAEGSLRELARQPDAAPAAHHLLAMSAFLVGLVTDREADFERFAAHADTVDHLLKRAPSSCWNDYMRAETELQRSVMFVKRERYLRAAWHARAAFRRYNRAVAHHPEFAELYKGLGLMHLGIGSLPGTWRRFLRILGYGGSVQQGLDELRIAADEAVVDRDAAALSIGLAQSMLGLDPEGGLARVREVHLRHPDSPFFGYLYGYVLLQNREAVRAEEVLRRYRRQGGDSAYQYVGFVDYYLAAALFVQDRFAEAEEHFRVYLNSHKGPALKAAAHVGLGLSLEMQGRRDDAQLQFRAVQAVRDYDTDAAARREAERRLAKPLEGLTRILLLGANAYASGRYDHAAELLTEVFAHPGAGNEERAEAAYRLGRVHQERGDAAAAMEAFAYAVEHPGDPRSKWAPWSLLHMGEIHAGLGDNRDAEKAFRTALDHPGPYDYEQTLDQTARAALEQLRLER